MQLRFGTFTHVDGTCSLSISKQAIRAQSGIPYGWMERWTINGILLADGGPGTTADEMIADIATKIERLETAYKQSGVDVELIGTNHKIEHRNTVNGIQVSMPPSYPIGENAEHVTYRTFQIGLEAEVMSRPNASIYLSYDEHIRLWGGGPEWVWTSPIVGLPRRLVARQNMVYWASQSGFAVAYNTFPQAPAPLYGEQLLMEKPRLDYGRSMRPRERSVAWEYIFASSSPIAGGGSVPNFFIPTI